MSAAITPKNESGKVANPWRPSTPNKPGVRACRALVPYVASRRAASLAVRPPEADESLARTSSAWRSAACWSVHGGWELT